MRRHPRFFFVVLLALTLAVGSAAAPTPLPLGSPAPDFSLPGVDGKTWTLRDFDASPVLAIIFTCNHCPTAQYYEERIKQLATVYAGKGVAVVAISPNSPAAVRLDELGWTDLSDSLEEMKIRARDAGFNFPYLYDGDTGEASARYGPLVTPHAFLFDRERRLRYVGAIDDSERIQHVETHHLRDAIDALLAGRNPPVAQTKVVGCSVKWSDKIKENEAFMAKLAAEPVTVEKVDAEGLRALRKNAGGKFRLINFWATWCAPCVAEFPELVKIHRMYRHREFEVVTVSANRPDEEARVLEFLKKQQASGRNLIFNSAKRDPLIDAFNPEWQGVLPYTVLLSPEGEVVYEETGSIDPLALKRTILKALNERKPW
jgi:thiol-disulfide isomerase/thioredoxin